MEYLHPRAKKPLPMKSPCEKFYSISFEYHTIQNGTGLLVKILIFIWKFVLTPETRCSRYINQSVASRSMNVNVYSFVFGPNR
jgi:hypothetical protein